MDEYESILKRKASSSGDCQVAKKVGFLHKFQHFFLLGIHKSNDYFLRKP